MEDKELELLAIEDTNRCTDPEWATWHPTYSAFKRGYKAARAKDAIEIKQLLHTNKAQAEEIKRLKKKHLEIESYIEFVLLPPDRGNITRNLNSKLKDLYEAYLLQREQISQLEAELSEIKERDQVAQINYQEMNDFHKNNIANLEHDIFLKSLTIDKKQKELEIQESHSKYLEAELEQQKFNNGHNLSIDQQVADRIALDKEINRSLANANHDLQDKIKDLEKELELRTTWTKHHRDISEIDGQKVHDAEKRIKQLEAKLKEASEVISIHLPPVFDTGCEGCRESLRIARQWQEKQ